MSWKALLKKEWRAGATQFIIGIIAIFAIYLTIYFSMGKYSPFLFLLIFAAVAAHLLVISADFVSSLRREWRENTVYVWMNLPVAGWKLLLSKLVIVFVQFAIFLGVTYIFGYILIDRAVELFHQRPGGIDHALSMEIVKETYVEMLPMFSLMIPFISLLLGLGAAFVFLMTKVIRPLGWLVGSVVSFGFLYWYLRLAHTPFYSSITEWGLIKNFTAPEEIMFEGGTETAIELGEPILLPLYTGQIVMGTLVLVIMFMGLTWLFDRKVQV